MGKIKILEVIGEMDMGGAETFLMNVLRNINKEKFEMLFLCYSTEKYDYEDEINKLGGKIIRVEKVSKKNIFKYVNMLSKIMRKYEINVIHSHTAYNSLFPILAAKKSGITNIITHSHNTIFDSNPSLIKKIYFKISQIIINKYSKKIACGNEAGKALYGKNQEYIVMDNGIVVENFAFDENIRKIKRAEVNIKENELVFIHVGRFDQQKNHMFLLDIYNYFTKLYSIESKLLLIGDGILREKMEQKVESLNIKDKCILLGKRNDVNELYSVADVLVFPSLYEGLPVTLIEAQANGIPILASDTIDKEVNITKKIKFLSLNQNLNEWCNELYSLKNSRYDCNELMKNSVYNMKKNVKKLEEIYEGR